jgi:hypothetical protein
MSGTYSGGHLFYTYTQGVAPTTDNDIPFFGVFPPDADSESFLTGDFGITGTLTIGVNITVTDTAYADNFHSSYFQNNGVINISTLGTSNDINFISGSNVDTPQMNISSDGYVNINEPTSGFGTLSIKDINPFGAVPYTNSESKNNIGTISLEHNDDYGASSIVFQSTVNRYSDFGAIMYFDSTALEYTTSGSNVNEYIFNLATSLNYTGNVQTTVDFTTDSNTWGYSEQSCLFIGNCNDVNNDNGDNIVIRSTNNVIIDTGYYNNTSEFGLNNAIPSMDTALVGGNVIVLPYLGSFGVGTTIDDMNATNYKFNVIGGSKMTGSLDITDSLTVTNDITLSGTLYVSSISVNNTDADTPVYLNDSPLTIEFSGNYQVNTFYNTSSPQENQYCGMTFNYGNVWAGSLAFGQIASQTGIDTTTTTSAVTIFGSAANTSGNINDASTDDYSFRVGTDPNISIQDTSPNVGDYTSFGLCQTSGGFVAEQIIGAKGGDISAEIPWFDYGYGRGIFITSNNSNALYINSGQMSGTYSGGHLFYTYTQGVAPTTDNDIPFFGVFPSDAETESFLTGNFDITGDLTVGGTLTVSSGGTAITGGGSYDTLTVTGSFSGSDGSFSSGLSVGGSYLDYDYCLGVGGTIECSGYIRYNFGNSNDQSVLLDLGGPAGAPSQSNGLTCYGDGGIYYNGYKSNGGHIFICGVNNVNGEVGTETLLISPSGEVGIATNTGDSYNSNNILSLNKVSSGSQVGGNISFYTYLGGGNYNWSVQDGDNAIIWTAESDNSSNCGFVIAPWEEADGGIRITSDACYANAWYGLSDYRVKENVKDLDLNKTSII